jgi:preprotein translocase subunit SecA
MIRNPPSDSMIHLGRDYGFVVITYFAKTKVSEILHSKALGFFYPTPMSRLPTFPQRIERPRVPEPLPKGLDLVVHQWIGKYRRRKAVFRSLNDDAQQADAMRAEFRDLSSAALQAELATLKASIRRRPAATVSALLRPLAAVAEAAKRTLGLDPFAVQLLGALTLARGHLAEMATGEGKTLTAGIAATLIAWRGKPCHIITVNDYLVERDANFLRPLYEMCGLTVGHVTGETSPQQRKEAYACDITYGTSKEMAADFLRDQLQRGALLNPSQQTLRSLLHNSESASMHQPVMRGLHFAIVDEADSLLIDEAVTPLIISARQPNDGLREAVEQAQTLCGPFQLDVHYRTNSRYRDIEFTHEGEELITRSTESLTGIWRMRERSAELLRQALVAREYYHAGQQFTINDGKIVIVDEFTGRPMADRTWRMGLHQAVEAAQGLEITAPTETVARISFQKFFRLYHQLSGMTGTAQEAAAEFWRVYSLPVVRIPTHRPCVRVSAPEQIFPTLAGKMQAIVKRIVAIHATGRPILVGTRTVQASEDLAALLRAEGIAPQVLNATRIQEEAIIISLAGQPGQITIATNMAGRGTDIKLGTGVAAAGGLCVLAVERHESGRVDRQLIGRCARQGDPGASESFASMEDELILKYAPSSLRKLLQRVPSLAPKIFDRAQRNAQRQAYRQRTQVLEADTWMEQSLSFAGKG